MAAAILGVDVGGTFTDAVLFADGAIHTAKTPTTPRDQSVGVLAAVDAVLATAGINAGEVERFAHGMTVGTNALLERRGARTALVTTAGFEDLLAIRRQNRPSLYRLCEDWPEPLVPAELSLGAAERTGPAGIETTLEPGEAGAVADRVAALEPESVAICLLHSYREPCHEQELAAAIAERLPGLHISRSSAVLPRFREFERCSTTVVDAYLTPLLGAYLEQLVGAAADRGLPAPKVMRSSGGVVEAGQAASSGAWSVLSGPAGGAVGAALIARHSAGGNAVGLDMGGTSTDVCVVRNGDVARTEERVLAGQPIQLPMVDVHTVGAGGGSIGWVDAGGALRAGPRSAGAEPGPVSYGHGGTEPTVTDANLMLGYLGAGAELAGGIRLDRDAAERALAELGGQVGLDAIETAAGIVRLANQEMMRAIRVVTVERGVDPRGLALIPFGGAGPLHCAALAEALDVATIVCPRAGGVLSALGLAGSEQRLDAARTVMLSQTKLSAGHIAETVEGMLAPLREQLDGQAEATYLMRYAGQSFELPVSGPLTPDPAELAADFAKAHEARYGYRDESSQVELVDIHVAVRAPGPVVTPVAATEEPALGEREIWHEGDWIAAAVIGGEPTAGTELGGPCVVELPEATLVLSPGWRGSVDAHGSIVAQREGAAR